MNKVHFPSTRLHPLGCHPKLLLFPSIRDHETSYLNHVTKSSDPHAGSLRACCSSSSFHCHILLHWVVLPYFPWMKHWCPSQNLSALVQLLSHQHRASNLGLWRTACVAQLSSGSLSSGTGRPPAQLAQPSHALIKTDVLRKCYPCSSGASGLMRAKSSAVLRGSCTWGYTCVSKTSKSPTAVVLLVSYCCKFLTLLRAWDSSLNTAAHELCHSTVCKLSR